MQTEWNKEKRVSPTIFLFLFFFLSFPSWYMSFLYFFIVSRFDYFCVVLCLSLTHTHMHYCMLVTHFSVISKLYIAQKNADAIKWIKQKKHLAKIILGRFKLIRVYHIFLAYKHLALLFIRCECSFFNFLEIFFFVFI